MLCHWTKFANVIQLRKVIVDTADLKDKFYRKTTVTESSLRRTAGCRAGNALKMTLSPRSLKSFPEYLLTVASMWRVELY